MEEKKQRNDWWKWPLAGALGAAIIGGAVFWGGNGNTENTVSVTPTAIVAEATPEPELTVTQIPTPVPEPSSVPSSTPTITPIPTEEAVPTEEPIPTITVPEVTEEPTPTEALSPTPTNTLTPANTVTPTATVTPMKAPTNTPTPTVTVPPTKAPTPSSTPIPTPSNTPTPTNIPTSSPTPVPEAWAEPKERKDMAEMLMAKVNEYRVSQGKRKWEDPRTYYDVNYPGLYDRLYQRGVEAAKRCCMEHSANHDSSQIGAGIYFYPWQVTDIWMEEVTQRLFNNWKNSSAHNKNMLYDGGSEEEWVPVAVMTVVEHFDGEDWHYCAIMTVTFISKDTLPEGLK